MRRLATVILGLVLLSGTAMGSDVTANGFLKRCKVADVARDTKKWKQGTEVAIGLCYGYIGGVVDMAYITRDRAPIFCEPSNVTVGELTMILLKYLNDHPERLQEHEGILTVDAFKQAFPCKAPKP
jgi:hypothetical protein